MSEDLGTFIIVQKTAVFLGSLWVDTVEAGPPSVEILRKVYLFGLLSQSISPMLDDLIGF